MALYGSMMEKTKARKALGLSGNALIDLSILAIPSTSTSSTISGEKAGNISFFAMSSAPTGWLKCNGATVSRSAYADLFASIGTIFGEGDGSTTFSLPDLRGEFIRGWDNARGIDASRTICSYQVDSFKAHKHAIRAEYGTRSSLNSAPPGQYNQLTTNTAYQFVENYCADTGGTETRPRNVALLPCIKY